eukprot:TRINITY_DN499_c0_g2_i1.p1 TRINITY_DN499_c0_g2~~TRINITY_DN499_c0_g2_i1.p1  ORF type:complete len:329 (+),score=48.80 TRINITY_DN499_c0_g2_i1:53-1039(+)
MEWLGFKKAKKAPDQEDLPQYGTFNDLAPEFQVTAEHDPDHIFPRELELVEQVRNELEDVKEWPTRYILIFLIARRHSVPHAIALLKKHTKWLDKMGFRKITQTNLYPFTPEELEETEKNYALFGGHTLFKHGLVDSNDRILQYKIMRDWFPKKYSWKAYQNCTLWWYYYAFQYIPMKYHRAGMAVVVDMKDMGWSNIDFSTEIMQFLSDAITGLPGRMRVCWIVNANWMLSSTMGVAKYVLSAKILGRMHTVNADKLLEEIPLKCIPKCLGGEWDPDMRKEWYELVVEWDLKKAAELGIQPPTTNTTTTTTTSADKPSKSPTTEKNS